MKIKKIIKFSSVLYLLFALSFTAYSKGKQPNVVIFLIDDMGWKDLGCYGARLYETPNIDKLCTGGVRFTNAYTSAPVCAPARAAMLSGIHNLKLGMWSAAHYIPKDTKLLSQYLKEDGYETWHVGKWHMGNQDDRTFPEDMGFDVNIGGFTSYGPGHHFWPYGVTLDENGKKQFNYRNSVPNLYEGGKEGEYLADRLTDESIKLLENRDRSKPFYLNFWHYAVHSVHESKEELRIKYQNKIDSLGTKLEKNRVDPVTGFHFVTSEAHAIYAGMIQSVDESVGKVVAKLKEQGEYENTIFVFYSDNGPLTDRVPCVPLMGGKNSTYEAGVRVPAFITWPGKLPAHEVSEEPIVIMDVMPTVLDAVGASVSRVKEIDGVSLMPLFKEGEIEARDFYWYFPANRYNWGGRSSAAVLSKTGYKYILFFEGSEPELYNINEDLAEENNIIKENPEIAQELHDNLVAYLKKEFHKFPVSRATKVDPNDMYGKNGIGKMSSDSKTIAKYLGITD
nr:sulfatase [uncultured Draconibacterium sp.]